MRRKNKTAPNASGKIIFSQTHKPKQKPRHGRKTLADVKWIALKEKLAKGGIGIIYTGNVLFTGKRTADRCVIKMIKAEHIPLGKLQFVKKWYEEIVSRLNSSNANRPRMAVVEHEGKLYIVKEAFVQSENGKLVSKFSKDSLAFFRRLNLEQNENNKEFFREALIQAGHLAMTNLGIVPTTNINGIKFIDVFNAIRKKDGKQRLYVADIDCLSESKNPRQAWKTSVQSLVSVVSEENPKNKAIGERIAKEVAAKMKIP